MDRHDADRHDADRHDADRHDADRHAPDTDLMFMLSQAGHALMTEMTAGLAAVGITPRSHAVLKAALAGDQTQSQLADQCALDKTTMVVTVDALERAGLAERRPSSTDRRARIIAVTPAGAQAVREANAIVERIYEDVLAALPAPGQGVFVDTLRRLTAEGGRLSTPVACEQVVRRRAQRAVQAVP
ncbi:MAG TPA: MarR family transcriptional regulator [Acidimicrobiales bacterium]|nr:MarR family transcriptional regulator [Acidimicrobiales bacterium]